jgi:DNA polymerase-3 subunit delta'
MTVATETLIRFKRIVAQGRLAHAYLFAGPEQTGKTSTVVALAKMFNCESPSSEGHFCDQCPSCRKFIAGNHSDMFVLEAPAGETIKIENIRQFIQRCTLRPFEAKWKVFLIRHAQRLTKEAANALLKTLEEPNPETIIFLTTSAPELCLDTIKSRCHTVHFFPQSQKQLAADLIRDCSIDEVSAQSLAYFADGSLMKAKSLLDGKFHQRKNKIIDEMVMKRNSDEYLRKALSDKDEIQTVLQVLLSFFRDMMLMKSGMGESCLANRDRIRDLKALGADFSFDDVSRINGEIIKAIRLFKDNLNVKMSLSVIKELVWVK